MPTFDRTPAELINTLTELLRDRYPARRIGDIFKELVQNADDAGARHCEFVILDAGIPEAANPLLRGPAVVSVNDGPFRSKDAVGIRTLSGASKADAPEAIGRFGLGQKSVFHLCEAWFYLGREHSGEACRGDIINPWAGSGDQGDPVHPEWDDFGTDRVRLEALADGILGPSQGFLLLWVPLRLEAHRRRQTVLDSWFKTAEDLQGGLTEFGADIGTWFAHLRHLRSVRCSRASFPADVRGRSRFVDVSADSADSRLGRPHDSTVPVSRPFSLEVLANGRPISAWGLEAVTNSPSLTDLASRSDWPRRYRDHDGVPLPLPEKAVPHGAVTIVRSPAEEGHARLMVRWAIFLPIDSPQLDVVCLSGRAANWDILLHGYFFPDSGRRAIPWWLADAKDQDALRREWNTAVRDSITLPRLLPVVLRAVLACDDAERQRVVSAIRATATYRDLAPRITATQCLAWVFDGQESTPALVASGSRILGVPLWDGPVPRVATALAAARRDGVQVARSDLPMLRHPEAHDAWGEPDLDAIKRDELVGALTDSVERRYMRDFLALQGPRGAARMACVGWLREAVRVHGARSLVTPSGLPEWTDLVAGCPRERVVFASNAEAAIDLVAAVDCAALIVPATLRPHGWQSVPDALTPPETRRLLLHLGSNAIKAVSCNDFKMLDQIGRLAASLIAATSPRVDIEGDPELKPLPLFRVWSARSHLARGQATALVSLDDLVEARDSGRAFLPKGMVRQEDVAARLFGVIGNEVDVLLVPPEIGEPLSIPDLSPPAICSLLGKPGTAISSDPAKRAALLERLVDASQPAAWPDVSVLRLLVHGSSAHRDRGEDILLRPGRIGLDEATLDLVLEAADDEHRWRVVDGQPFAAVVTAAWYRVLAIRDLDDDDVVTLLRTASRPDRLRSVTDEQRVELLRLASRDADVWRSLPLHRRTDGVLVCADRGRVFLASSTWPVPILLRSLIDEIALAAAQQDQTLQARFLTSWGPLAQARVCLSQPDPGKYALLILDTLPSSLESLKGDLRKKAWLQTPFGAFAPEYLLDVPPEVLETVPPGLLGAEGVYCVARELEPAIRQHESFQHVPNALATNGPEAVDALAEALESRTTADVDGFSVSPTGGLPPLPETLEARGLHGPGWPLLAAVEKWQPGAAKKIGDALSRHAWAPPDFISALKSLAAEHQRTGLDADWRAYCHYFGLLAHEPCESVKEVLQVVPVRAADGVWRAADEMASAGAQLATSCLVHPDLPTLPAPGRQGAPGAPAASAAGSPVSDLRSYFASWGSVSRRAIGDFLAVLGSGSGLPDLAQEYLDPHGLDSVRATLNAQLDRVAPDALSVDPCRHGCRIAIQRAMKAPAWNLLGGQFEAELRSADAAKHLIANDQDLRILRDEEQPLVLRELPDTVSPGRRLELLRESLRFFVQSALGLKWKESFEGQWERDSIAGQVSVDAVRSRIMKHLPAHLGVLGCQEHAMLLEALRDLERATLASEDARDAPPTRQVETTRELTDAGETLRDLIAKDVGVQQFLLKRVRHKLAQFQYTRGRVVFELFQNADDAVVQLDSLWKEDSRRLPDVCRGFSIERRAGEGRTLVVRHWGRPINAFRTPSGSAELGKSRAFDLDLLHMMLLNVSDKEVAPGATGRFGLGFKAVHLVARKVRVSSGLISCEVEGGFLPKVCASPPAGAPSPVAPTTFELELEPEVAFEDLLDPTWDRSVGILPVVAQRLRRISVDDALVSWEAMSIGDVPGLCAGPGVLDEGGRQVTWLRFGPESVQDGPLPAVVVALDGSHAVRLEGVPAYWCTVPTAEPVTLGYVLNGPFDLDVGRTRLAATSDKNTRLAATLGEQLAAGLRSLFALLSQHGASLPALGIAPGEPARSQAIEAFWVSLWGLFSTGLRDREPHPLLAHIQCGGRGLSGLASRAAVIPTGLRAPWGGLTQYGSIRGYAVPLLEQEDVHRALTALPNLGNAWPAGTLVAGKVAETLHALGLNPLKPVSLSQVLDAAVSTQLTPADAASVGPHLVELVALPNARPAMEPWLAKLEFKAEEGGWMSANQLLLPKLTDALLAELARATSRDREDLLDEARRAAFAPSRHTLAQVYASSHHSLSLVLAARDRLKTGSVQDMERWAIGARGEVQRAAVLRYVASGSRGRELAAALRERGLPWLASLDELRTQNWRDLLGESLLPAVASALFPESTGEALQLTQSPPITVGEAVSEPAEVLQRIADWWADETVRDPHIRRWHEAHYPPQWSASRLAAALRPEGDPGHDEAWMLLLTLGATQCMGRSTPSQHREFVQWFAAHGAPPWWSTVCSPAVSTLEWGTLLEQWGDSGVQSRPFDWWGWLIPVMCHLRRGLDVYRRILLNAETILAQRSSVDQLWAPYTNPVLRGDTFDAAPLVRFSGQAGNWVLRELSRLEVISGPHVRPYCYPPRRALRELLGRLGFSGTTSSEVFAFLSSHLSPDQTAFCNSFDIPLALVALNPQVEAAVLAGAPAKDLATPVVEEPLEEPDAP